MEPIIFLDNIHNSDLNKLHKSIDLSNINLTEFCINYFKDIEFFNKGIINPFIHIQDTLNVILLQLEINILTCLPELMLLLPEPPMVFLKTIKLQKHNIKYIGIVHIIAFFAMFGKDLKYLKSAKLTKIELSHIFPNSHVFIHNYITQELSHIDIIYLASLTKYDITNLCKLK
jgi:hypothetical protein